MAITGRIGTSDSQLGNIVLGGNVASGAATYDLDISESLTIIQVAAKVLDPAHNISETLTLSQTLVKKVTVQKNISQSLILINDAVEHHNKRRDISEILTLINTVTGARPQTHFANIINTITFFEQLTTLKVKFKNISETLTIIEEAAIRTPRVYDLTITETLAITQALPKKRTTQQAATNTLVLVEAATSGRAKICPVNENLVIIEFKDAVNTKIRDISQTLTLSQTATAARVRIRNIHETLTITQALVSAGNRFNRNITEIVPLKGGMLLPIRLGGYKVAISEAEVVKVPKRCFVTLECPLTGTVITLPCPQMGDTQKNLHSQVIKRSMNNVLYTYIRSNRLEQLNYSWVLGSIVAQNLESFCDINIGNIITLSNWKGEIWKVNITTNPIDFIAKSLFENEGERWEVTLEFQGVKILG